MPHDRILVVEDDEHIAFMLDFLLAREGYAIQVVPDGRQAAAVIDAEPRPRLVLLDVMLPFVDGFELIGRIRANSAWSGVPIVMLTSKGGEKDVVRALDAGADDYVMKPFQPQELLARLRRYLRANVG